MTDIAHLLRPGHLQQLANILKDAEASANDRFVALELLKNANVAAGMVLPGCQDTGAPGRWRGCSPAQARAGTAIVQGKKGQLVWTEGNDAEALSRGVFDTYVKRNLRYSQVSGGVRPASLNSRAAGGAPHHVRGEEHGKQPARAGGPVRDDGR